MSTVPGYGVNQMLNLVCGKIHEMRKKELNAMEIKYVMDKIKSTNPGIFTNHKLSDIVPIMAKVYLEDLKKLEKYRASEAETVDVHEYLVNSIGNADTSAGEQKLDEGITLDNLLQTPKTLLSIINPQALRKKAYLILDRRYQSAEGDNRTVFTWNIVTASGTFDKTTSAVSTMEIKDIVGMRLYPFRFPNTAGVFGNDNTITVEIVELNTQAYVAAAFAKRFHFSFNIFRQNPLYGTHPAGTDEPFKTSDMTDSGAVISFKDPISKLDNISIRFGNPFNTLILDLDKMPATLSAVGATTLIDFGGTNPHYCALGDSITITGFSTTTPLDDFDAIQSANHPDGWYISAITATTITIDMDISGLNGAIVGNPMTILLDAKRFILRLEIDYIEKPDNHVDKE